MRCLNSFLLLTINSLVKGSSLKNNIAVYHHFLDGLISDTVSNNHENPYFLANDVPVITSKSNSFFTELEEFGDFHAIEDYEENLYEFLVYVDSKPLSKRNEYYHDFSTVAWKSFLL